MAAPDNRELWIVVEERTPRGASTRYAVGPWPSLERRAAAVTTWRKAPLVVSATPVYGRPPRLKVRTPALTATERRQVAQRALHASRQRNAHLSSPWRWREVARG